MQTWEGLRRGAFHENVYDGSRTKAVEPQRMFEDAMSEEAWRKRGFVDVLAGGADSLLLKVLTIEPPAKLTKVPARESLICPQNPEALAKANPSELSMPYALPKLSTEETELFKHWIAEGAHPFEKTSELSSAAKGEIKEWHAFFNATDLKTRIVARYLYEHLFLAHLYFKNAPQTFFKLIRSSTACESPTPLNTRRPNNDPGVKTWFYCLVRDPAVIVYKNHLPFELSSSRLTWLRENFLSKNWTPTEFPSFADKISGNPLLAFKEIPVEARYRFLLSEAQYEVATFIKGPVCNGSFAVNSIQEQFYVFFVNPKSDLMVRSNDYAKKVASQLLLPGSLGSDLSVLKVGLKYKDILQHRKKARLETNAELLQQFPEGLTIKDIWNGDEDNPNAVLTVFRNDDNARVYKGARGDLSKTVFVLDYSTFERLVYNLVVNFDVFDNVSHQLLTRLYMDILRMDSEDNFLQFLPSGARLKIKNDWYRGFATQMKIDLIDEKSFANLPAAMDLPNSADAKLGFVRNILFHRLNEKTRAFEDPINWKSLRPEPPRGGIAAQLSRIASIRAVKTKSPFPNFFPEVSLLILTEHGKPKSIYSILRNREHQNLSWILSEKFRLSPEEDTLTVLDGVSGAYPNQFLVVEEANLTAFADATLKIKSQKDFAQFLKIYGISRMDERFWSIYDFSNSYLTSSEPIAGGILDLSRYAL